MASTRNQVNRDEYFMSLAVQQAKECRGNPTDPFVGAVAVLDGNIKALAFRGEKHPGEHAEYTLLEGKLKSETLAGSTIYTSLEPCTKRGPGKVPCAARLIERKVARVVIGMLDPDQRITGRGVLQLRRAGIAVDLFPPYLAAQLEELNREFTRSREATADATTGIVPAGLYKWDSVPELQFSTLLHRAREVWVLARSGVNMLSRHSSDLRDYLNNGGELRLMICDPDSPHSHVVYGSHKDLFKANISVTQSHIAGLTLGARERVKVKYLPKPPNLGILLIRGPGVFGSYDSVIQVMLYPDYSSTGSGRPMLTVLPSDKYWFDLFMQDILLTWNGATQDSEVTP